MNHVVQCWLHDMDDVVDVDLHTTCSVLVKTGLILCFMNLDGMRCVISLLLYINAFWKMYEWMSHDIIIMDRDIQGVGKSLN